MFDGGLIIVAGLLAYCLIEIRHWRGEYLREYERAEDFKGDVHILSSRCRDLEATFLVLRDEANERNADLMAAEGENTWLRAELEQVKKKYLHAVADAAVFED